MSLPDLTTVFADALDEFFSAMLDMAVTVAHGPQETEPVAHLQASVAVEGDVTGQVAIELPQPLVEAMGAAMLGEESADADACADTLRELISIVAGNLRATLEKARFAVRTGPERIASGTFRADLRAADQVVRFTHGEHAGRIVCRLTAGGETVPEAPDDSIADTGDEWAGLDDQEIEFIDQLITVDDALDDAAPAPEAASSEAVDSGPAHGAAGGDDDSDALSQEVFKEAREDPAAGPPAVNAGDDGTADPAGASSAESDAGDASGGAEPAPPPPEATTGALASVSPPTGSRRRVTAGLLAAAVAVLAAFAAHSLLAPAGPTAPPPDEAVAVRPTDAPPPSSKATPAQADPLLSTVAALQERLVQKGAAIERLRDRFRQDVRRMTGELAATLIDRRIQTLEQALADTGTALTLDTIRRRRALIDQLIQPAAWVTEGVETLRYLQRRARLEVLLQPHVAGLDPTRTETALERALHTYRLDAPELALPDLTASLPPLETVWQSVSDRIAGGGASDAERDAADDPIAGEIRRGKLHRVGELTVLGPETAAGLVAHARSDLMLNGLTDLTADTARVLATWQGTWLCLNGLIRLNPATARELARWPGERLSLNGLRWLDRDTARILATWPGGHLELAGLSATDLQRLRGSLALLSPWRRAGGRLYLAEPLRRHLSGDGPAS